MMELLDYSKQWNKFYLDESYRLSQPNEHIPPFKDALIERFGRDVCVLDVGYGAGRHVKYFYENGFGVSGFDISGKAQEYAKKRLFSLIGKDEIDLRVHDMNQVPWPYNAESFQGVLSNDVLHHTTHQGFLNILKEITRMLVPGGLFLASVASRNHHLYGQGRKIDKFTFVKNTGREAGIPHCFFRKEDVSHMLGKEYNIHKAKLIARDGYGSDLKKEPTLGHLLVLAEKK